MILFNREFLFVHSPKTAGTSLLDYFRRALPETQGAAVERVGTNHPSLAMALGHACGSLGQPPSALKRIITVARNPYDREVSSYLHFRRNLSLNPNLEHDLNSPSLVEVVREASRRLFPDYLHWLWEERGTCDVWNSEHYYRMTDSTPLPQLRILRLESLDAELEAALEPLDYHRGVPVPRLNTTYRAATSAYYDDHTIDIVTRSYGWLFETGLYAPGELGDEAAA